jgi:hypothetical protein
LAIDSACKPINIHGHFPHYAGDNGERLSKACHIFREEHDEWLEEIFLKWDYIDTETGIIDICEVQTEACKEFDHTKFEKPRFYLDGVEQAGSMVKRFDGASS